VRTLDCLSGLDRYEVTLGNDHVDLEDVLARGWPAWRSSF
jgi:hypothetical protein